MTWDPSWALALCWVLGWALIGFGAAQWRGRRERRKLVARVEAWRRDRPRAPLVGVFLRTDPLSGRHYATPVFTHALGVRPLDADPLTGERVQYGWSDADIREALARPSEFFVGPSER